MPFTHEIQSFKQMVVVTATMDISMDDSIQIMYRISDDPRFKQGYRILVDVRDTTFAPNLLETYRLSRTLNELQNTHAGPIAVVVPTSKHLGIAKIVVSFVRTHGMTMNAFLDINDALAWLDLQ